MDGFEIHPDIRQAWTLPARVYRDPDIFARMRSRVFARSWQLVAHERELPEPGSLLPRTLGDDPILLVRGEDGAVRAMSNVCTHRGALLVESPSCARSIRCRYHGRRFGLEGRFLSMPEFGEAAGFPSPSDDLPAVALGSWRGFLFASLDPELPFERWIEPMRSRLEWAPIERVELDRSTSRSYPVAASWALYVDNYLEGFHVPFVHDSLAAAIDYGTYATETFERSVLQVAPAKPGEPAFDRPEGRVGGYYWWLFPATMFNLYPWGLSVNMVRPETPERTTVVYESWVWEPSLRSRGAGAGLDRVELEDESVVESVQRGVRSRLYDRGRYSPTRELGVHRFHRLLAGALSP